MKINQDNGTKVESLAKVYTADGSFNEAFLECRIYNLDTRNNAELDIIGPVPIPPNAVPIVFDCKSQGHNISAMTIRMGRSTAGVLVCWTRYAGFIWNQ